MKKSLLDIPFDSTDESKDDIILKWINGTESTPENIKSFSEDTVTRVNWFVLYNIIQQSNTLSNIVSFIKTAETKIFDPKRVETLSQSELIDLYNLAQKRVNDVMEFTRKFSLQNKDLLKGNSLTDESQILLDMLKKLSKEDVLKLSSMVQESIEK